MRRKPWWSINRTISNISDTMNHRVRKVEVATGLITTVAGNGDSGYERQEYGWLRRRALRGERIGRNGETWRRTPRSGGRRQLSSRTLTGLPGVSLHLRTRRKQNSPRETLVGIRLRASLARAGVVV